MAVKLDNPQEMQIIYEACKAVFLKQTTSENAIKELKSETVASDASLRMYFTIYSSMRKGVCYKMGTSEAFTQYLLTNIFKENGEEAFVTALSAVKSNMAYRESVNNAQPGLRKACAAAIEFSGLDIDFDSIPADSFVKQGAFLETTKEQTIEQDILLLKSAKEKKNADFAETIMSLVEKNQWLSEEDIAVLTDRDICSNQFKSDYPFLLEVENDAASIDRIIRDNTGRVRYYQRPYKINNKYYVFTSQLYRQGGSHRDNRTPFYNWILSKAGVKETIDSWWPDDSEYSPGLSKDQWIDLLKNEKVFIPNALTVMASFYAEGGQATCAQLGAKYGNGASFYIMTSIHLAERVIRESGCAKPPEEMNSKLWPVLYVGKNASADQQGAYIWKLRSELYDALTEFGIEKYIPTSSGKKTWLLSWNPSAWHWDNYREVAVATHIGQPYEDSWTCMSIKVQPGDRVFLTVLGKGEQNGVIASGYASRGSYEDEHWDPEKAAQGKKAKRIDVSFDWIADYETDPYLKQSDLKELFPEQEWSPMASGISIQDQYVSQLEEEWAKAIKGGGEEKLSVSDTIANIKAYIAAAGFTYEDGLIENFYLSLKSKPFVILAGTSGTGKTRLVKLFAEAIGATGANGRYQMVSVRPDWSDSTDLFGHVDLNGNFIAGAIIDFVKRAETDINNPYVLCLDEMNLARVEYYLSDILSVIETRDFDAQGNIVTDPLVPEGYFGSDTDAAKQYGTVRLPENLYIVGTVNMDETTFPFSKKVLDRANTIEFSNVDLTLPVFSEEKLPPASLPNSFLKTKYLLLKQCMSERDIVEQYCAELEEFNKILAAANAHVGYRVRDEIVFYLLNNHEHGLLSEAAAMDNEIMQKILPRIQGSSASVKNMLCELFKRCAGDFEGYGTNAEDLSKKLFAAADKPECKYRNSAKKIAFMVRRFEEDGFTSYWL